MRRQPGFALELLSAGPDKAFRRQMMDLETQAPGLADQAALALSLRQTKARIALTTAVGDLSGQWELEDVTTALSNFADLALNLALARLFYERMKRGVLVWPMGAEQPPDLSLLQGCGLVLLALGKLGGRELNYSSDIDLIALFDQTRIQYRGKRSLADCLVKIIQDLVALIARRTADGYVFRTDFRLRPDPGSTPLAVSVLAAETYYQSVGKNWERSAMIKARPCAGDLEVGDAFLEHIRPFVWRRNLDYAAIEDIHEIKSQVHDFHRHGQIATKGHDIKIGRGGIREIEFFAQIQQLIAGGRDPALRSGRTLEALQSISDSGKITQAAADELSSAYVFLRTLENRLQMIDDEQTHRIPDNEDDMDRVTCLMGFDSNHIFEDILLKHLRAISGHYEHLPGGRDEEGGPAGFQITDEALPDYMASLGFKDTTSSTKIVASWRIGRYRALRAERSRRLLKKVLGGLLEELSRASNPDRALARFDRFLGQLPAGVQLFSLFRANPWLFRLLAGIMGSAPLLADHLGRRPQLLDSVLDPDFFDPLPDLETLAKELDAALAEGSDYQDALDAFRRWLNDRRFGVGVQILTGVIDIEAAGQALADLADVTLTTLLPVVQSDFEKRYGTFPGHGLALIAMGSYGGRELSYTSDLDLILLYHADPSCPVSSGPRQLAPSLYFSRLGQHLITALSALTGEGRLYEIDLRLRPSGRKGPLVVTLETFEDYQINSAWTWEHMALTRARIVAAVPLFAKQLKGSITRTLHKKRDPEVLREQVRKMRHRLDKEFGTENCWSVKYVRGGLVDIEFVCQYLLLREGHRRPDLFDVSLSNSLANLAAAKVLDAQTGQQLGEAYRLQTALQGLLRICFSSDPFDEEFSEEIKDLMTNLTGQPDFESLRSHIEQMQSLVYSHYKRLLDHKDVHEEEE
jgi:glutamate-ammonia-ligase adenylyltransferase